MDLTEMAKTKRRATSSTTTKAAAASPNGAASPKGAPRALRGAGTAARWTEEQVELLLATVSSSRTAKEAFHVVAEQIDKSVGTVQQKYYALQRKAGGGRKPAGRKAGARRAAPARAGSPRVAGAASASSTSLPTTAQLRALTADELVSFARAVKAEVDRRRRELDTAANLFK